MFTLHHGGRQRTGAISPNLASSSPLSSCPRWGSVAGSARGPLLPSPLRPPAACCAPECGIKEEMGGVRGALWAETAPASPSPPHPRFLPGPEVSVNASPAPLRAHLGDAEVTAAVSQPQHRAGTRTAPLSSPRCPQCHSPGTGQRAAGTGHVPLPSAPPGPGLLAPSPLPHGTLVPPTPRPGPAAPPDPAGLPPAPLRAVPGARCPLLAPGPGPRARGRA